MSNHGKSRVLTPQTFPTEARPQNSIPFRLLFQLRAFVPFFIPRAMSDESDDSPRVLVSLSTLRAMSDDSDDSTSQSAYESDVSDVSTSPSAYGLYFQWQIDEYARRKQSIKDKGAVLMANKAIKLVKSWSELKSLRSLLAFRKILRARFNADTARQIVQCLLPDLMISRASGRAECETRSVT